MSAAISTPPSKASRGGQQRSSRSPLGFVVDSETTPSRPKDRRNKQNRSQNDRNQAVQAHSDGIAGSQTDTENAHNVDYKQGNITDGGIVSDGLQGGRRRRPPKGQRAQGPNNSQTTVNEQQQASPPRTKSANPRENGATPAAKSMAYAGPTFHASPAPSALPMPKLFSKSVPAETHVAGMQARLDADSAQVVSPKDERPPSSIPPRNEESPLDFFFNADRAEKAKRTSANLTPNGKLGRLDSYESSNSGVSNHHLRQPSTGSGRGLFPIELDGNGTGSRPNTGATDQNVPPSPMDQYRPNSMNGPATLPKTRASMQGNDNVSRSLKDMLFALPKPMSIPPAGLIDGSRQTPSPFNRPGPGSRSTSGPITPVQGPPPGQDPASFHYGNRNLSPLFKAAKGDSVQKGPSQLRQEIPSPQQTRFPPPPYPNFGDPASPVNHRQPPRPHSGAPLHHGYAHSPVREQPYAQGQYFPQNSGHVRHMSGQSGAHPAPGQQFAQPPPPPVANGYGTSQAQNDVSTMENDLRRLLKLNLPSAGGNGSA